MADADIDPTYNPLKPVERTPASQACEYARLILSSIIVTLLIIVAFVGMINGWSVLKLHPAGLFVLLLFAITMLAYVEMLHYACVSVEKWDMEKYKDEFPRAYACYRLVDTPDKVKKFLVGRQFCVIFIVFLIAEITVLPDIPKDFLGMPPLMVILLIGTGLPGIAITLTYGQLISQIFVEEFCLKTLNIVGAETVIRISLFLEFIGICHFSWLLYYTVSNVFCKCFGYTTGHAAKGTTATEDGLVEAQSPTELNRGPNYVHVSLFDTGDDRQTLSLWDMVRFGWSTTATLGAIIIVLYGISVEAYILPVPPGVCYIVFFCVLTLLFYLEGLMIAIVATQYWDKETFKDVYPRAYRLHELINRPDNVKRFIIGRQFVTVLTGFVLAQITTFKNFKNFTGAHPIAFWVIVKSGLVGVFIVLAFGQLLPELLAQEFPLRFMNMPGSYTVGAISLYADKIGVGHCAWTVYYLTRGFCCDVGSRKNVATKMNSGDLSKKDVGDRAEIA